MMRPLLASLIALLATGAPAIAHPEQPAPTASSATIHADFWKHLADPDCSTASRRWRTHYGDVPKRLRNPHERHLQAHFAQVVAALHDAGLPSEFALIPFVESRYRPNARSPGGQAGLWQFTAATARRNGLVVRVGHDQRLEVHASTRAAVHYLQRLYRLFDRDWRWTVMAYNAGESATRKARGRSGQQGLSTITRHYPDKLHALACLIPHPDPKPASG